VDPAALAGAAVAATKPTTSATMTPTRVIKLCRFRTFCLPTTSFDGDCF
jgi:hypothetical protein